jgi:hypothetical protein
LIFFECGGTHRPLLFRRCSVRWAQKSSDSRASNYRWHTLISTGRAGRPKLCFNRERTDRKTCPWKLLPLPCRSATCTSCLFFLRTNENSETTSRRGRGLGTLLFASRIRKRGFNKSKVVKM